MDAILLRQVCVVDPVSPWHLKNCDILVRKGIIEAIDLQLPDVENASIVEMTGLCVSPGWVDLLCYCGEPGFEERETLDSLSRAAIAGGFVHLLLMPDNQPMPDNEPAVRALCEASQTLPVYVHVAACLTQNAEGLQMSEMLSLREAGAAAFSDGLRTVRDPARFTSMLEYASQINIPVIHRPGTPELEEGLWAAEGPQAVAAGLKGVPEHAETLGLFRDVTLARYTGARLHLQPLSGAQSLQLWKNLKETAPRVTLGTTAPYLFFHDPRPEAFDPLMLLCPPLRGPQHAEALRQACSEGLIYTIASGHQPLNAEIKDHEPDLARPGMETLETAFAMAYTALADRLPLEKLISMLTYNPAHVLGLNIPSVAPGQTASLTLFNPLVEWIVQAEDLYSRSRNTPLIGSRLRGKPLGIIAKGRLHLNKKFS
ncbi:MAG: dihydroorotase [Flavobacteriales bacterium]|nr:dihydroorotase [Flavobacteriales bacterium]MCX7769073.1 dihydroorotase [Flavobacteriales bacterium]MDW8410738.1 dihydroorotase [Flavobacteriales bacterium]